MLLLRRFSEQSADNLSHASPSLLFDAELAPFRNRMSSELFEQSHRAAVDRLIRERHRLPTLTFE